MLNCIRDRSKTEVEQLTFPPGGRSHPARWDTLLTSASTNSSASPGCGRKLASRVHMNKELPDDTSRLLLQELVYHGASLKTNDPPGFLPPSLAWMKDCGQLKLPRILLFSADWPLVCLHSARLASGHQLWRPVIPRVTFILVLLLKNIYFIPFIYLYI